MITDKDWVYGGSHRLDPLTFIDQVEAVFDEDVEHIRELPSRGDILRSDRRSNRNRTVTVALVALIAIGSLLLGYFNTRGLGEQAAANAINTGSIQALAQARDQLRASGVPESQLPPVVNADPTQPIDVDALVAATTATVLAKIRTDPSYRGQAGIMGLPGTPCDPLVNPACVGKQGVSGEPGKAGESPACLLLPGMCIGPMGLPGAAGKDGADSTVPGPQGPVGPPGETCPEGTSLKPIDVVTQSATLVDPEVKTQIIACLP